MRDHSRRRLLEHVSGRLGAGTLPGESYEAEISEEWMLWRQ